MEFEKEVVDYWQDIWDKICRMSYEDEETCSEIITNPPFGRNTHFYERNNCANAYTLTFSFTLDFYKLIYSDTTQKIVPELKKLSVPKCLFGVEENMHWFLKTFPNCTIEFW